MHQLVYESRARPGMTLEKIEDILVGARATNTRLHVTGVLLFKNNRFLQVLEGDRDVIATLYDLIKADERHYDVNLLRFDGVFERAFPDWSMGMAFVGDASLAKEPGYFNVYTNVPLMVRTMQATKEIQELLRIFVAA
jgi:hypothetical protein